MAKPAPWEEVAPHEQLFVLITGANSGVGLGIAQRLIDEFLATRSLSSHLILIPTTRSADKCLDVIRSLRSYAEAASQSPALASRAGGEGYRWEDTLRRIHVLSLAVDLCDLRAVQAFAHALCRDKVGNPPGLEGEYLTSVRVPRLDTVVFNAAYGGWTGCDYFLAIWIMITKGLVQAVTWPCYKNAAPTSILNECARYGYPQKPLLGEVFCACVFGHYVLAHDLLPLLARSRTQIASGVAPGRIAWSSSIEAVRTVYEPTDLQSFLKPQAYESSKRLIDIMALTSSLPSVRPFSSRYLRADDDVDGDQVPPRMYVIHPGVVASSIFPLPWYLFWAYQLAITVARLVGSPWHNVDAYRGAKSAVWIALSTPGALDAAKADRVKWGSATNRNLETYVKKTEVDGWGWEGDPETDESIAADGVGGVSILRKSCGRRAGATTTTTEDLVEFEELGVNVWAEMEKLRCQWEHVLQESD